VTVRWRDINGTFDADDIQIKQIMSTPVPTIDQGQIWIPIDRLREMMQAPGEASLVVLRKGIQRIPPGDATWIHRDHDYLLKEFREMIRMKSGGINVIYGLLLFMGLLAVFDTQVLAVWRRRNEIGTLMAFGMERSKIVGLFTLEGALHGILSIVVGAVYGIPLMALTKSIGLPMPEMVSDMGIAIPQRLYPSYGSELLAGTIIVVLLAVTIVSFLPVAKLSKLKPTEALRGRLS
jgi:ABC-type lipoprotein release transport system permease subunit